MDWLGETNSCISWRDEQSDSTSDDMVAIETFGSQGKTDKDAVCCWFVFVVCVCGATKATPILGTSGFLESFESTRKYKQGMCCIMNADVSLLRLSVVRAAGRKLHALRGFVQEAKSWQRARNLPEPVVLKRREAAWKKANCVKSSVTKYIS